jgi:REP element-mobilizing transposase RayT
MAVEVSDYPLAYFITWTTYGSWLPGDDRGWTLRGKGPQLPDFYRQLSTVLRMSEDAVRLNSVQRMAVEDTIRRHCQIRGWLLHAVSCRTNHVHVVVSAPVHPDTARDQFKAYCTRKLNELNTGPSRERWWTERGKNERIDDIEGLDTVVQYVVEAQDRKDRDEA